MIQVGACLRNIDNSGAKLVSCIGVLSNYRQKYASIGDIITVKIFKLRSRRRLSSKVKKGQILKALIVRTKKIHKENLVSFLENSVILLTKQHKLVGTRIFGSLPNQLRYTKHLRILFLAAGLNK